MTNTIAIGLGLLVLGGIAVDARVCHPETIEPNGAVKRGGGVIARARGLREARRLCTERSIVMIADEVQTGCGRTGTFLRSQPLGLEPDLVTLAKPLAAGVPRRSFLLFRRVVILIRRQAEKDPLAGWIVVVYTAF